jgi:hypothetical protein
MLIIFQWDSSRTEGGVVLAKSPSGCHRFWWPMLITLSLNEYTHCILPATHLVGSIQTKRYI